MAPPIPPDEPVISAVFPVKSNIKASPRRWNLNLALLERGQHGLDFLRRLGTLRGQRTLDAPVEAGQHLAGAELDHRLDRSEEHTSELQSLMRISYAVFCLKKKKKQTNLRRTNALCKA